MDKAAEKERTVCIIDDDTIIHTIMKVKLKKNNSIQNFLTFTNGKFALDYFKKEENRVNERMPDVIFLDINMPIIDGWQFLEQFEEISIKLEKKVYIYMLSSSIDNRDIDRAHKNKNVKDYLTKPMSDYDFEKIFQNKKNN